MLVVILSRLHGRGRKGALYTFQPSYTNTSGLTGGKGVSPCQVSTLFRGRQGAGTGLEWEFTSWEV